MSLLSVERLSIAFHRADGLAGQRDITMLQDVSLCVASGEVMALIGASGAGKSLVAHALFGILPGNALVSGDMRLDGQRLDAATRAHLNGRQMALVPQSIAHLDPLVRCGRQVGWAARRSGRPANAAAIAAALARFDLPPSVLRAWPHQLSGGMVRRVLLAIATIGNPALIVADEPTSGLDDAASHTVLRHLRDLADAGAGVLLITHSLAEALSFADRVAVLEGGRLRAMELARAFAADGATLVSPYARALWQALPQNGFGQPEPVDA